MAPKKPSTQSEQTWQGGVLSQFVHLLLIMLRMKVCPLLFLPLTLALLISNFLVLPEVYSMFNIHHKSVGAEEGKMQSFGSTEFVRSKYKVYVASDVFPKEFAALSKLLDGKQAWMVKCSSNRDCQDKFITEYDPNAIAAIRYSESAGERATLDCLWQDGLDQACAFLYQAMAQSAGAKSWTDKAKDSMLFKEVNILQATVEMKNDNVSSQKENEKKMARKPSKASNLPNSTCTEWVKKNQLRRMLFFGMSAMVGFASIGASFYIILSTLRCIQGLKADGFLQQLFRNGLCVTSYWLVIWLFTIIECAALSGVFILSNVIQCPEVYNPASLIKAFLQMILHFLILAAIVFMLDLLLASMFAVSAIMLAIGGALTIAFFMYNTIKTAAPFLTKLLPITGTSYYVQTQFAASEYLSPTSDNENDGLQSTVVACAIFFIILLIVNLFLDFMLKNGNGLCLPIYFPFSKGFWCPAGLDVFTAEVEESKSESEPHLEAVIGLPATVVVESVSKAYRGCPCCEAGPTVLQNLSCKIYRGQITALIGHNGAGKSTLIKLLTGEEQPDSGSARICGCLATDSLARLPLRGRLGICPQFDALCESLTVMECVRITLLSKAINSAEEMERARQMLRRLGLGDKEDVKSRDLSGGQQRKVSTVLSLLGAPEVVFLDEPTSGLDPVSRRQLWQLLQEEKVGRCIVLCTQFMDEADILADRKIFLCGGTIVCAGSSMFLKRAFGCSFALTVSLRSKSDGPALLARLNQVRVRSQDGTELQLEVPAAKPTVLTEAVQTLETSREVAAFGLSQASLDDIFMRLSGVASADVIAAFQKGDISSFINRKGPTNEADGAKIDDMGVRATGLSLSTSIARQFGALLCVNVKRQIRVFSRLLNRFLVPTVLIALLAIAIKTFLSSQGGSELPLHNYEMDVRSEGSEIRYLPIYLPGYQSLIPVMCISDGSSNLGEEFAKQCNELALNNKPEAIFLKHKSAKLSLEAFMMKDGNEGALYSAFNLSRKPMEFYELIGYHASSWNAKENNDKRSVSIVYAKTTKALVLHSVHTYGLAVKKLLELFTPMDVQNTTALSFVKTIRTAAFAVKPIVFFSIVFTLFPISYMNDPIEDITSRVRAYLLSTGMSHIAYWINTFFMHWLQYIVCSAVAFGLLMVVPHFRTPIFFIFVVLPVLLLGTMSNQLTVYTIGLIIKSKSTIVLVLCNLAAPIMPIAFVFLSSTTVRIILWIFPPAAPVALATSVSMYIMYMLEYYHMQNVSEVPKMYINVWCSSNVVHSLVAMLVHIVLLIAMIILLESYTSITASCCQSSSTESTEDPDDGPADEGAIAESYRMLAGPRNAKHVLEVRRLRRTYPNGVRAVRGVSFGVLAGEIFGLLGANGAGKSTTMSVIVGEEVATEGQCEVRVGNGGNNADVHWLSGREGAARGAIGFCPQYNPLFDCVTVEEHIRFYADIRGLPTEIADKQVDILIKRLGLQPHRDKKASQLSGGNKRRLCLAIALLGDPSLIIIDEASTGVDPENKRFIWLAIRRMLRPERSVMITTHSMEEVEALCTRVGIMNRGRMISVGTVQQLRSQHGDAYTLDILLQPDGSAIQQRKLAAHKTLAGQFRGLQLQEDLGLGLQFTVPKAAVPSLSDALRWLSANQSKLGASYTCMYQMSLDQVFVKVVKMYDGGGSEPAAAKPDGKSNNSKAKL